MKLMGCIFIAAAAAFLGFRAAERLKAQVRALDELSDGLMLLEQELELHAPELELLMRGLSGRTRGTAQNLFGAFADGLSEREVAASVKWEQCVCQLEYLIPEGKSCLCGLGDILGRYDSREQRECVSAVRRRLEHIREMEGSVCQSRCRTCQTVGLSGGAFLIVLLL